MLQIHQNISFYSHMSLNKNIDCITKIRKFAVSKEKVIFVRVEQSNPMIQRAWGLFILLNMYVDMITILRILSSFNNRIETASYVRR